MEFKKYDSIENSYREKEIERIYQHGFGDKDIEWVVTEKVHGSNFGFICGGNIVQAFKRTSILSNEELEKFFDADIMYEKYKDKVLKLTNYLQNIYNIPRIQIFGEHFGGIYNDQTEKGYTRIQREVHYIPFTDFIVFDIMIWDKNTPYYLDWDIVKELSKMFGFKTVPELFRGTFTDCLNFPNEYQTKVPELYGLEPIENNISEGNVIKPINTEYFPNGERVILKNKNNKFKEKGRIKKPKNTKNLNLNDEERKWVDEISRYFEVNRIQNLLSKGDVKLEWKQFGKVAGLFFQDALDDFKKDNPDFEKLEKGSKKLIQRYAQKQAQDFIRDFMKRTV